MASDKHAQLLRGDVFDTWTDDGDGADDLETDARFGVDADGFFLHWKSDGNAGGLIDLALVSEIRDAATPTEKKVRQARHGADVAERSFGVCWGCDYVSVECRVVACKDVETKVMWMDGLRGLIRDPKGVNCSPMGLLKKHWRRISLMINNVGKIPIITIIKTFASGNKNERIIYDCLNEVGLPSNKNEAIDPEIFTFDKFYDLCHKISPRDDIEQLFNTIGFGQEYIGVDQFVTFLNESQRDPMLNEVLFPRYTVSEATEIMQTCETDELAKKRKKLSKEGFARYLISTENNPFHSSRLRIYYMDMNYPLSSYYINSSHNTYLTGLQIYGTSSVEMYRQVLLAGCRCVELDCWNGKEDEEPIITHGKAMCSQILFRDVIYAIRDTAFVTSEFPVILSLENHCNTAQQYKMAKYLVEILGEYLLTEPLKNHPLTVGVSLPSPNALKKKILIKNKRLKPEVEKYELELFKKGQIYFEDFEDDIDSEQGSNVDLTEIGSSSANASPEVSPVPKEAIHVHPWLSSMVNYIQPVKFPGFEMSELENINYHMSSFSEPTAINYVKNQAVDFVKYTNRHICRIYPKGIRTGSSNYNPQDFWNVGSQIVAMNFQTTDLPMQLNLGRFEYNGRCGYLLKPDVLRSDKVFDPDTECPIDGVCAIQCSVQVISGLFLSDKMVGTYVEVDMYGLPTDTCRKEFRTKIIPSNGLNPVYNEEPFLFRKVVLPELAVLRFGVYEENGKLLGQRVLSLTGLQAGYRHITLRTEANFPLPLSMLFCKINMKVYVPDAFSEIYKGLIDPSSFLSVASQRPSLELSTESTSRQFLRKDRVGGSFYFEEITAESISKNRNFRKDIKRLHKKYHKMKKKLRKQLMKAKKQQCFQINQDKSKIMNANSLNKLINFQTMQMINLLWEQRQILKNFVYKQIKDQEEIYVRHLQNLQTQQIKQLTTKHEKDKKELTLKQARLSLEMIKEVQRDRTLKTKRDKDSRLKEKQHGSNKTFIEEFKSLCYQHEFEMKILKQKHEKEAEKIIKAIHALYEMKNEDAEYQLWKRCQFFD